MDKKNFKENVYRKYDEQKQRNNKTFFSMFPKIAASVSAVVIVGTGIVFASNSIKSIWKEPEKFNFWKEMEVSNEDKLESISEKEAIEKSNEILQKLGYNDLSVANAEIKKYPSQYEMDWWIKYNSNVDVMINAYNGHLKSFHSGIDDSKVKSTYSKDNAKKVAEEMYKELPFEYEDEYILTSFSKILITDDCSLWQADFCKVYDGIVNVRECVRLTIIPETKELWGINIFEYNTENNPVQISEDEAIAIAKEKAKQLQNDESKIKKVNAELSFERMNEFIYEQEEYLKKSDEEKRKQLVISDDINENYQYRTEPLVRKVWKVEIEYNSEFSSISYYYVDATTGEIIGGDATM